MGYSARYHAASLAAVFLALGIGILIGSVFGDDLVRDTQKGLESSLRGNLDSARDRADDLASELGRSDEFAERAYPAIVGTELEGERVGVLEGDRVGVLALGGLPDDLAGDIEAALGPAEGRLVEVAVVREPPDLESLDSELAETRFAGLADEGDMLEAFSKGVGRQLVLGGPLLDRVRGQLLSRASGSFGALDGLIVVRDQPANLDGEDRSATSALEAGILDAATATRIPVVGVEREDSDPSSIGFLSSHGLSTVDDLDAVAGWVAMVFALLGAEGNFGVKETADSLLPDLLAPVESGPPTRPPRPPGRGPGG